MNSANFSLFWILSRLIGSVPFDGLYEIYQTNVHPGGNKNSPIVLFFNNQNTLNVVVLKLHFIVAKLLEGKHYSIIKYSPRKYQRKKFSQRWQGRSSKLNERSEPPPPANFFLLYMRSGYFTMVFLRSLYHFVWWERTFWSDFAPLKSLIWCYPISNFGDLFHFVRDFWAKLRFRTFNKNR